MSNTLGAKLVKIYKGVELTQCKEEIPNGKIVQVVILGPKNYVVIYIDGKTYKLMAKARCKSIPHTLKDYDAREEWMVEETETKRVLETYERIKDKSSLEFVWVLYSLLPF